MFSLFLSNPGSSGVYDISLYIRKLKLDFRIFGNPFDFWFGSGSVIRI